MAPNKFVVYTILSGVIEISNPFFLKKPCIIKVYAHYDWSTIRGLFTREQSDCFFELILMFVRTDYLHSMIIVPP